MRSREDSERAPARYRLTWRIGHWHRAVNPGCKIECGGTPHIAQQDSATTGPGQTSTSCGISRKRTEAMAIHDCDSMRSSAFPYTNGPQEGNATHRPECQDIPPEASRRLSGLRWIRLFGQPPIAAAHETVPMGFSPAT